MREDRWQHLAQSAFRLEEQLDASRSAGASANEAHVRAAVESLLEVFDSSLDPVEDFEAYAVRRFAHALRRALGG